MDELYEHKYHQMEANGWWFVTRRERIMNIVRRFKLDSRILDVGCSSGQLLADLQKQGYTSLTGIDVSTKGVEAARNRGFNDCHIMDGQGPAFEPERFDVVISSDSLEHMEQDELALSNWHKLLKPGGHLIVFVPAYMWLWSEHDEVNHHYRRYTAQVLSSKVRAAGFDIEQSGYWNSLLLPPIAAIRVIKRLMPFQKNNLSAKNENEDDLRLIPAWANSILKFILRTENRLSQIVTMPFGVSAYIVARKNS